MNIFRIALPGFSIHDAKPDEVVLDNQYASPKINTVAQPPHAGVIRVNWNLTTPIAGGVVKEIYSFPHGYNYIPTTFGTFAFDNGTTKVNGILPFQYGILGMLILDSDKTNVRLIYQSLDLGSTAITPFTLRVRYYVFAERGHE